MIFILFSSDVTGVEDGCYDYSLRSKLSSLISATTGAAKALGVPPSEKRTRGRSSSLYLKFGSESPMHSENAKDFDGKKIVEELELNDMRGKHSETATNSTGNILRNAISRTMGSSEAYQRIENSV